MTIKSFLKLILILILLALSAILFVLYPTHAQVLHYKGQTITIRRNDNNIPYIVAPSRQSFFYAIGRVHAQDRLFQTVFKILVVQGRLSEYLGQKPLPMDKFMRELNLNGWGKQTAQRLQTQNQTQYSNFNAYVSGINEYANSLAILPFDFQLIRYRWQNVTVGDIFGLFKLLEWSQSMNIADQFVRSLLLENYTKEQVYKYLPITKQGWAFQSTITIDDQLIPKELTNQYLKNHKRFKQFQPEILTHYNQLGLFDLFKTAEGSNVWAISGEHTKSRKPILVHDPHLENSMPSQWYQLQATYFHDGSNHSISGISTAGVPFIIGQTDYLALGVTTIYMDNQDLYRQKIQGNKYLVNDKWIDLKIRQERIKIKTAQGLKQEIYIIRQTHRGPLLSYIIGSFGSFEIHQDISLTWTGFNDQHSSVVLTTHLAQVKDIQHVKTYLLHDTEYLFNVNIVFITTDGHIGHQQLGRYPIRRNPDSAHFVKDGSTTEHDWLGFVPPSHRLQTIDPPKGYIINGNNKLANDLYYNGLHKYTIYTARSDRMHAMISQLIQKGHKLDVEDARRIISDTVDCYCQRIKSYIVKNIPESANVLSNFDCNFVKGSYAAAMYEVFIYQLHHLIKVHKLEKVSILSMHTNAQFLFNYIKESAEDANKAQILRNAWANMKLNLQKFFKSNDQIQWKWGMYHKDAMHHLPFTNSPLKFLYDRQFDGYGNLHTVNVGKMNKVEFGNFETSHRANYRAIYSFVEGSFWIIDSGSSEKWFSKHYDDQWKLFQENQFLPLIAPSSLDVRSNSEL